MSEGALAHVLVAEDEAAVAEIITEVLSEAGFRVTWAADGLAALTQSSKARFDILLTDVRMPNLDGVGLIRQLRRSQPGLPIIVLSGYMTDADRDQLRLLGVPADAILEKPVSFAQLSATMQSALAV